MDSDNFLSLLNSLAQGAPAAPTNVLQQAAPDNTDPSQGPYYPPPAVGAPPAAQAPQQPPPPSPAEIAQAATDASPPAPKPRRSLIDTIGRISDVLATVGGANPLYQPTLDAREDRTLKLGDHDRQVLADNLKIETDKFDLGDKQNLRVGQAARGLKAIIASNPGVDVGQAWSALAERMQLDPATTQSFGSIFAAHPEEIDGIIASMTDPKYSQSKYGGNVVYGTDANGKLIAFQPSLSDEPGRNILPEGVTPIDPPKFVDVGGAQVGVGTRSGKPTRILPKTEAPGRAADRSSRERIATAGNASRERIAATRPGAKGTGPDPAMIETAQGNLDELRTIYGDLNKMGAMVSTAQSTDKNVVARIRASGIGQTLEGAAGTKAQTQRDRINSIRPGLMQSLAKATGMTGKQLDSNADVKLFMQTVTDPTKSYEANIKAIDGLERFLHANAKKNAVPPAPAKSGWTVVGVK